MSTADALCDNIDTISQNFSIDIQKAFDTHDYKILLKKLYVYISRE